MNKINYENSKNSNSIQNKECFSRMNFLLQASILMAGQNNTLASYYGQLCRNVGKRAVLRLEPNVKRIFCKRCSLPQEPGVTAVLSASTSKRKKKTIKGDIKNIDENTHLTLKCLQCSYVRSFHINTNYDFWLENPNSIAEVIALQN